MTAIGLTRDDNPRWLAAVTTALPVALALLFVGWCQPDTRRLPAAVPLSRPAPAITPATESHPDTTVARAQ